MKIKMFIDMIIEETRASSFYYHNLLYIVFFLTNLTTYCVFENYLKE